MLLRYICVASRSYMWCVERLKQEDHKGENKLNEARCGQRCIWLAHQRAADSLITARHHLITMTLVVRIFQKLWRLKLIRRFDAKYLSNDCVTETLLLVTTTYHDHWHRHLLTTQWTSRLRASLFSGYYSALTASSQ